MKIKDSMEEQSPMGKIATAEGQEAPAMSDRKRLDGTVQQENFWSELQDGTENIVLEARAGTGKSTSCREGMHRLLDNRPSLAIRYCCFNKAIADEFQARCPDRVDVGTMHRFGKLALPSAQIASDKTYTVLDSFDGGKDLKRYIRKAIASLVSLAKNHALRPGDPANPHKLHQFINVYDVEVWNRPDQVVSWADWALSRSAEQTNIIDFDDMLWLPVLLQPRFPSVDYLFIDEVQDLNPVQHEMAALLAGSGRTIVVGDPYQCQPAGTRVALTGGGTKLIEDIREGDQVVSFCRPSAAMVGRLEQGRRVTAIASHPFTGFLCTVEAGLRETRCTPNHKWITRFAERNTDVCVTYLMRRGNRFRVGWCQLFNSQGSLHLGVRTRLERADAAWILGVHDNRTDASVQESVIAARHGLPTIPFEPVENAQHMTTEAIDRIFSELASSDLVTRANCCLQNFGRSLDHPFYTVDLHQRQGRTTIFVTQACNLIPGLMMVPVYAGYREPTWTPIERIEATFVADLPVYSLQVETNETYVADGLVTHNSIYGWRGADVNSMDRLRVQLDAKVMPLTVSFRCPRSHVELAQRLVPDFEAAPDAPEGILNETDECGLERVQPGDMVLCRANAPIVSACLRSVSRRVPAVVRGRAIGDQLGHVVSRLCINSQSTIPDFMRALNGWQVSEINRLESKDGTDHLIEQVVDKATCLDAIASSCSSPAEIPGVIRQLFDDGSSAGRITYSSVHRAKGSEARRVAYIQVPYSEKRDRDRPPQAWELDQRRNLRYVALTRSMEELTLITPSRKGA